jgi:tRNA-specific 2-thiouridylase
LLLPLGDLSKEETRAYASRFELGVADKLDSQEICFVEGGDYRGIVERAAPERELSGAVVTMQGERVGSHAGIDRFTVGQRRELPATHFNDGPRYVTQIDASTNTIVIGREEELYSRALVAREVNLIWPERFENGPVRVRAMTRYRAPMNAALASFDQSRDELRLEFEAPERAVAPGQLVALYDDANEVLGGATIRASE